MSAVTVFFAEVAASIVISSFILARLQRLLRDIGSECEQGGGATEFWVAYTQIMMLVAPVLLIAWFSQAGTYGTCDRCGATIPEERLERRAFAATCVACQPSR